MHEAAEVAQSLRWAVSRLASRLRAQHPGSARPLTRLAASVLANLRHSGPLNVTSLAGIEGLQPQSLTRVLQGLESAGLVARSPDERDRRAQRIAITEHGRAALNEHVRDGNRWLAQAIQEALTPAERDIVRVAAGLLLQVAEHRPGLDATAGGSPGDDSAASGAAPAL